MEAFIHEEYVSKRREQQRRRRPPQTTALHIQTGKGNLPPPAAGTCQESPRGGEPTASSSPSAVGSLAASTETASSFRDHLFDYLKPY
ncbi:hypothetical protein BRADI_3g44596v3 [Brachypodium distachyon]|uniref:Uncharacterized protein n=1 Tax=Brachypodium distachyon TaxID=15368 RepID=A0A2K2D385_BRADI|nr:hypothetical protein BRADI_3g44596v3 [Brachypodium distachyon]PNT68728.1 hypothetical protein BRADI_3g44596v3 [Brachypodium distachyon]